VSPTTPVRDEAAVAIARGAFSAWLRAEREARGISLEEIARVTKIQIRTLERLEDAAFDELPADVFVRGFIRNYARVVGVDANQALQRYDDCGVTPGPVAAARARAMLETVGTMAPRALATARRTPQGTPSAGTIARATPAPTTIVVEATLAPAPIVVEAAPAPVVVEAAVEIAAPADEAAKPKKTRTRKSRSGGAKRSRKKAAVETAAPESVVVEPIADLLEPEVDDFEMTIIEEPAPPAPPPVIVTPPRPHRPRITARSSIPTPIPSLVIDDDAPDLAERAQAARELDDQMKKSKEKAGRSFLPQSLLDGDRGTRQGGLTLAVIILLIVATLTLSYLMRRPSSSGEGVTALDPGASTLV